MSGRIGKTVIIILVIATILFGLSSFAGDHETAGLLQFYIIPCFTLLALIITVLIAAIRNDRSKGMANASAQIGMDQYTTSIETSVVIKTKGKLNATNTAFISGVLGIIITMIATILLSSGAHVDWKLLLNPDNSEIEDLLLVESNKGLLVKTSSGHYYGYNSSVIIPAACGSDCWDEITPKEWSNEVNNANEVNSTNNETCHAMILSKKPPVEQVNKEFIFKECKYYVSYTRIVIDKNNNLWLWHKSIEPFEILFKITLIVSVFTAPTFALIGVAFYNSFSSRNRLKSSNL